MNDLLKSKTFWAGIAGIITAAGGYYTGEFSPAAAIQTALGSLIAIFLRDGVRKADKTNKE